MKKIIIAITPPVLVKGFRFLKKRLKSARGRMKSGEQASDYYDNTFDQYDHWKSHYTRSHYYPLWSILVDRLLTKRVDGILDIGCGPGQFARFLYDKGIKQYIGLDFSARRIEFARKQVPAYSFHQDDIFTTTLLRDKAYTCIICMEFLEHINEDTRVMEMLPSGKYFLGTVPNFTDVAHVRFFKDETEVADRYGRFFSSFTVTRHLASEKGKCYFIIEGTIK